MNIQKFKYQYTKIELFYNRQKLSFFTTEQSLVRLYRCAGWSVWILTQGDKCLAFLDAALILCQLIKFYSKHTLIQDCTFGIYYINTEMVAVNL
jgi:hypothetical protein